MSDIKRKRTPINHVQIENISNKMMKIEVSENNIKKKKIIEYSRLNRFNRNHNRSDIVYDKSDMVYNRSDIVYDKPNNKSDNVHNKLEELNKKIDTKLSEMSKKLDNVNIDTNNNSKIICNNKGIQTEKIDKVIKVSQGTQTDLSFEKAVSQELIKYKGGLEQFYRERLQSITSINKPYIGDIFSY